nr:unnamed protein product [Digitaria exilis]
MGQLKLALMEHRRRRSQIQSRICLKIPCLKRLSSLEVSACNRLQVIESKAPNLSYFSFGGNPHVQLPLGGTSPIKKLSVSYNDAVFYARTELPSRLPNLEALIIFSHPEAVNTPMVNSKFLHLKFLHIILGGRDYDFLSLVSFFDASPSLENFRLTVIRAYEEPNSIFLDPLDLRTVPGHLYYKLKFVEIINFSSAKSLIELTCHILGSTRSLERLTLDTTQGFARCSVSKSGKCLLMHKDTLVEAGRALVSVETYIKPNRDGEDDVVGGPAPATKKTNAMNKAVRKCKSTLEEVDVSQLETPRLRGKSLP